MCSPDDLLLSHLAAGARALMLSQGVARLYPGIIATGDGRRGRDTKLVVARNRWFESISLQRRVSVSREFALPMSRSRAFPAGVCGPGCLADGQKRRRGGRMIVTTRVREASRGRLVTPLDAAARWNGRGDEEVA